MTQEFIVTLGALLGVISVVASLLMGVYKLAKTEANIYTAIAKLESRMFEALDRQQDKILSKVSPLEQKIELELREMKFRNSEQLSHIRDIEGFLQKQGFSPRPPITYDE
ncbi:MAG: hypothetical protein SAJ12_09300 [Jaaginema sp. PMC 1079.18]|nr:hypothetical protein [Jaaginema sp. PMC 1079.18]MEC4864785.1 hypothetical protein [Jaaginema sp. PMC 1078.18]